MAVEVSLLVADGSVRVRGQDELLKARIWLEIVGDRCCGFEFLSGHNCNHQYSLRYWQRLLLHVASPHHHFRATFSLAQEPSSDPNLQVCCHICSFRTWYLLSRVDGNLWSKERLNSAMSDSLRPLYCGEELRYVTGGSERFEEVEGREM